MPDHGIESNKTLWQSAQETVAKALGGGSRGGYLGLVDFSGCADNSLRCGLNVFGSLGMKVQVLFRVCCA